MADRLTVIPGVPHANAFAAYPMAQVLLWRWGAHRVDAWALDVFLPGLGRIARMAVMDDFGTLVVIPDERR